MLKVYSLVRSSCDAPVFPAAFQHLRLCALDPYDLALSKLERNIQRDREDVKYLARTDFGNISVSRRSLFASISLI